MEFLLERIEPLSKVTLIHHLPKYHRKRSLRPSLRNVMDSLEMLFQFILWSMAQAHYNQKLVLINDMPASEFLVTECGYINETCSQQCYRDEELIGLMQIVVGTLVYYCEESMQTTHDVLMQRFKEKGLHGMHNITAKPENGTISDHDDCVVCMNAKRTTTFSSACAHKPIMCSTCSSKVQRCPVCAS